MASHNHQSLYCFSNQEPPPQDYSQGLASLDNPAQPSLCSSGQSPFLQAPDLVSSQEEHQVVVASNDLPVSDMDLVNILEMDDKALSELAGVNCAEWNSLFNGQLDDMTSLDPMTGVQSSAQLPDTTMFPCPVPAANTQQNISSSSSSSSSQPPQIDRWLVEETQKLERQQKIQQQKLMELQQTLLKTEILKNQLQIATISQAQSPTMSTTASLLLGGLNNSMQLQQQQQQQQQQQDMDGSFDRSPAITTAMFSPSPPQQASLSPVGTASVGLTISGSVTSRGGRMSTSSSAAHNSPASSSSEFFMDPQPGFSPPASPFSSDPNSPEEPCKRKVHNLIEKKYRCSINDRIGMLRDMVTKYSKDNKKLQKSAVLQKTIDFINHLQNSIRKLQDENQHLREALATATGQVKSHLPSFSSPPNTPARTPSMCDSEVDSGHPSSPDDSDGQGSPTGSRPSFFNQLLHNPMRQTNASQYLMVLTIMAVFFVNPLAFYGPGPTLPISGHHSGARTLSGFEMVEGTVSPASALMWAGMWMLRLLVAGLCFGWMTLRSMPRIMANSQDSVHFWRLRKQAEKDLQKGEYVTARSNLEVALSVVNRPIPTSYLGMISGLLWSFCSHLLFQAVVGRGAVYLASLFIRRKAEKEGTFKSPKKPVFGVTFDDVSVTYHLLHQVNMASSNSPQLLGMGYFLALNALNFAEADRPFNRLGEQQLAEMYFALGLQCHNSLPRHASSLPMWYYFFCFRNTSPGKYATPLKWAVTEPGKAFLMGGKWTADVTIGSRLYTGNAALPLFSVTRAYCKELLCETFGFLLLPDSCPDSGKAERDSETALQAFKLILNTAKDANACLLSEEAGGEKSIKGAEGCSDSGFPVLQWWASVGLVSCYWLMGKESLAEDFYPNIEALSDEMGAAVPSALQLAFKASRMYKRPSGATKMPLEVVIQLCATTSNSLEGSVANLMQDHSNSAQTRLYQLGLLQACDWLLSLKMTLWENHEQEDSISQAICPGFYQDLETLSKLVSLLPSARSRLHLYKGCYQLIAGASPIAAQAMLNSTGNASLIRRRRNSKDSDGSTLSSQEHAMAKVVLYKHLPASMEPRHAPFPPSSAKGVLPTRSSMPARV